MGFARGFGYSLTADVVECYKNYQYLRNYRLDSRVAEKIKDGTNVVSLLMEVYL